MDIHDPETRSYNMSQIKGKDTKPEMLVRKYLFSKGFRFRLHDRKLPGTPDIVLPKYKTIILVHGCFWHGHEGCKYFVIPKTNTEWWTEKIMKNKANDEKNKAALIVMGWKIMIVFECALKKKSKETTLNHILTQLTAS